MMNALASHETSIHFCTTKKTQTLKRFFPCVVYLRLVCGKIKATKLRLVSSKEEAKIAMPTQSTTRPIGGVHLAPTPTRNHTTQIRKKTRENCSALQTHTHTHHTNTPPAPKNTWNEGKTSVHPATLERSWEGKRNKNIRVERKEAW